MTTFDYAPPMCIHGAGDPIWTLCGTRPLNAWELLDASDGDPEDRDPYAMGALTWQPVSGEGAPCDAETERCIDSELVWMCGTRPLSMFEMMDDGPWLPADPGYVTPEDLVNVVPCDGTITLAAIEHGPLWIARQSIRDNLAKRPPGFICKLLERHYFEGLTCTRCGVTLEPPIVKDAPRSEAVRWTLSPRSRVKVDIEMQNLPPPTDLLGISTALEHAARSGEGAAVCEIAGRHDFEDNTCSRCGIMREALIREQPVRVKVEQCAQPRAEVGFGERGRRHRRGPLPFRDDDGESEFEKARQAALDSMGDALKRGRS